MKNKVGMVPFGFDVRPTKIEKFLARSESDLRELMLERMDTLEELMDTSKFMLEELVSLHIGGDIFEADLESLIRGAVYIDRLLQKYGDLT